MGSISMGTYAARVNIDEFKGLFQDGDETQVDPSYALEAVNADTTGGMLATMPESLELAAALDAPIGTLACLYRRWNAESGERNVLVAASGGRLYWMLPDAAAWEPIALPEGSDGYASDEWSWAAYEINEEGMDAPVDVLLLSNAKDGMVMVRGDTMEAVPVETPKKFGVIARYAERIWGGAIPDDPDTLVYSAPFNPLDWSPNVDIPEDGAGDVMQPSWDGDSFQALMQFGSQLLAFKRQRIWRILGTDPGEYVFREQYGGGAAFQRTVAVHGERVLMLGRDGLLQYDGRDTAPYYQQFARSVFRRMNQSALTASTACVYKNRYYCALPLDGSAVCNAVLIFNTLERTWLLCEGITVEAFLPTEDGLYFTNATVPGKVFRWGEGQDALPLRWMSPWVNFDRLDMRKGGWTLYLTVDAKKTVELLVTIQTEKKKKQKVLRVQPAQSDTKLARQQRITFGGSGRRWRFSIESKSKTPWKVIGGIQIDVELDPD